MQACWLNALASRDDDDPAKSFTVQFTNGECVLTVQFNLAEVLRG